MLLEKMQALAAEMKFEEAQKIKEKYLLIENYRSKSEVVSSVLHNIDVFSIEEDEANSAFINYLHITNGAINQAFTFEYKKKLNESKEELLTLGIIEMRYFSISWMSSQKLLADSVSRMTKNAVSSPASVPTM